MNALLAFALSGNHRGKVRALPCGEGGGDQIDLRVLCTNGDVDVSNHARGREMKVRILIVLTLSVAILVSCGNNQAIPASTEPSTTAQAIAPTDEPIPSGPAGKVIISQPTDIVEVQPHRTLWSSDSSFHFAIFDSLLQLRTGDMKQELVLCESYENASPTEWIFHLVEGVKFHNGEPFNAETVKWNVEDAMNPNEKRDPKFAVLAGAEVIDEYTVKIILHKVDPTFLTLLPRFYMLPPGYMAEVGEEGFAEHPIGTGPYKFVERVRDSHITLTANTEYFRGAPSIKDVVFKVIPESSTALSALMAGEVDLVAKLSPDDVEVVRSNPNLYVAQVTSARGLTGHFFPDSPQGTGEPLKDVRVRQAIEMAINVESYIENILGGYAERISTWLPPQTFAYDHDLKPYPYDPERAKQLLAEAGYEEGFQIKMDVIPVYIVPKTMDIAQAIASDLSAVGIEVLIRPLERATAIKYRDEKQVSPIVLWSWGGDSFDPYQYYQHTTCGHAWGFWCDPKIDELYDAALATVDQNERAQIYTELQGYIYEQCPMLFLYNGMDLYGVNSNLNFTARPDERILVWELSWKQ